MYSRSQKAYSRPDYLPTKSHSETSFQRLKGSKCLPGWQLFIYRERDQNVQNGGRLPIEHRGDLKLSTVVPYLLGTPPSKYLSIWVTFGKPHAVFAAFAYFWIVRSRPLHAQNLVEIPVLWKRYKGNICTKFTSCLFKLLGQSKGHKPKKLRSRRWQHLLSLSTVSSSGCSKAKDWVKGRQRVYEINNEWEL